MSIQNMGERPLSGGGDTVDESGRQLYMFTRSKRSRTTCSQHRISQTNCTTKTL